MRVIMRPPVLDLLKLVLEAGGNLKRIKLPKCSDSLAADYYLIQSPLKSLGSHKDFCYSSMLF